MPNRTSIGDLLLTSAAGLAGRIRGDVPAVACATLVEEGLALWAGVVGQDGRWAGWAGGGGPPASYGGSSPTSRFLPAGDLALDGWQPPGAAGALLTPLPSAHRPGTLVVALRDAPDHDATASWGAYARVLGGLCVAVAEGPPIDAGSMEVARRLESLLDEAPGVISLHRGPEHQFQFVNRAYRDSSDGRPIVGRRYADAFPEFVEQGYLALFDGIYRTGQPFLARGVRADTPRVPGGKAEERYWNLCFQATRDTAGAVDGVSTFAFEVTDQVLAMRAADAARRRYDELVATLGVMVWTVHIQGWHPLWVGGATDALLGCSADAALDPTAWWDCIHPDDRAAVRLARESAPGGDGAYEVEFRVGSDGGGWRWLCESGRVGTDHDGGRNTVSGLTTDVSRRRVVQAENERLQAQLLHVQKLESLGVLAGGIAHDFNNLLTGILGQASLAELQVPVGSPAARAIAALVSTAKRAAELTRQLLAYSGRGHFKVEAVNLNVQVTEMVPLLEATMSKNVSLRLDLAENVPPVVADVAQLQQVLLNLAINGAEAIGEQPGIVSIRTGAQQVVREGGGASPFEDAEPGDYVFVEVSDTGVGMDAATRDRVFDPFFTTKVKGRGLGLATVQGIIRGHKGRVHVYSEPGRGTTFKVLLPASAGAVVRAPDARPAGIAIADGSLVLVVDDEDVVRELASVVLDTMGLRVVTASDGAEGLRIFRERAAEISLVLLDLTMPKMSGEEVYREIQRFKPGARVILSSGYNEAEATRRLMGRARIRFLQKPYTAAALMAAVSAELAREPD